MLRLRQRIEEWAEDHGAFLRKARNRGCKVWAIHVPRHSGGYRHPLGHRYTLTDGLPCWEWASTLRDLSKAIGLEET